MGLGCGKVTQVTAVTNAHYERWVTAHICPDSKVFRPNYRRSPAHIARQTSLDGSTPRSSATTLHFENLRALPPARERVTSGPFNPWPAARCPLFDRAEAWYTDLMFLTTRRPAPIPHHRLTSHVFQLTLLLWPVDAFENEGLATRAVSLARRSKRVYIPVKLMLICSIRTSRVTGLEMFESFRACHGSDMGTARKNAGDHAVMADFSCLSSRIAQHLEKTSYT
ncbi:hypothetical protein GGX14DRAFT_593807 [Mycena pura]|uniref:Uncharacterized protein n=1 Tax=Mycena pura TaxID=153505 RepID=A0AAD6UR40_9AGAR|nr:hypothetical protein GGX14DRAFT_593807 [Mycena pura]